MKLAIATGTFHPETGGPPTYLRRLCLGLIEAGHDVRLVSFGEPTTHRYRHPVVRVSRSYPLPIRLVRFTANVARLAAWCDVMLVSDYGLPAAVVKWFVPRPLVIKVVSDFAWETASRRRWIADDVSTADFQRAAKVGRVAAVTALQRFYVSRADRIIVPSDYLRSLVEGWGARSDRMRVIHNAVDVDRFGDGVGRDEARDRLGLKGFVLLTLARTISLKGIDYVIRSVAALRSRYELTLVHCGEGPDEDRLRMLARSLGVEDRVRFEGRVSPDRVPLYVRAADLAVVYSSVEGLSHALLEVMAGGLCPVVSDRGGNPEVVQDGTNGRIVSRERPEELTRTIEALLLDPEQRARLGRRARLDVEAKFTWPRLLAQTLQVLEEARAARS